jgi:putative restriction endonuclease
MEGRLMPSLLSRFGNLRSWERGTEAAPHKPLLVLYALGRWYNSRVARIPFSDVDSDLEALLIQFGPSRDSNHPEYPFWWLQSDKIWEVRSSGEMGTRTGGNDPKKSELLQYNATGGFTDPILAILHLDPEFVFDLAQRVLDTRFPLDQHAAILERVGLVRPEQET